MQLCADASNLILRDDTSRAQILAYVFDRSKFNPEINISNSTSQCL
jgi:hypothetical protein